MKKSVKILLSGIVQGVGFRPFVMNAASRMGVYGTVSNSPYGVEIYAYAEADILATFIETLKNDHPPQAHIAEFSIEYLATETAFNDFTIIPSQKDSTASGVIFIPTDLGVCDDCTREMFSNNDDRFEYPFINCTQCGPRYTIIKSLPYDRATTTMDSFQMCDDCLREYLDNTDRRYHAQPNACPKCGPYVYMGDLRGEEAVSEAVRLINRGEIVAIKGIGGYHLVCDATNDATVQKLRHLKQRQSKPFAVMCNSIHDIDAPITEKERQALLSPKAPIVIINWQTPPLSPSISPDADTIGVMLAYTPLHKLIISKLNTKYIVATSGNRHDEPIVHENCKADEALSHFTPYILHHNRDIESPVDDSVARLMADEVRLLRRGRGFAPYPVGIPHKTANILAVGAQLKSTITLSKGKYAFVSQYIGDMDNVDTVDYFHKTYVHMSTLLRFTPDIVVCDKHPGYYTSSFAEKFAKEHNIELLQVQHHHAHAYAVMAERGITGDAVHVVLDGTGYGDDGAIWGGEIFAYSDDTMQRVYHLEYTPQIGGDLSVKYPKRMAQSYLMQCGIWDKFWQDRMGVTSEEAILTERMINNNINSIPTSSAGRLFESVGSMVTGVGKNDYEGHTAILMENLASNKAQDARLYSFYVDGDKIIIAHGIRELAEDIMNGVHIYDVAYRFHKSLAMALFNAVSQVAKQVGTKTVTLSGGVFQNKLLLEFLYIELQKAGYNCLLPTVVPTNDGGISLGQAFFAGLQ